MSGKRFFAGKCLAALCCVVGFSVLTEMHDVQAADLHVDEAKAQEIALSDAGAQEKDTKRLNVRYEREDGEDVYEVEFYYDGLEYEYMLRESDGMILEWSVDGKDVGEASVELSLTDYDEKDKDDEKQTEEKKTVADGTEVIGIEAAKEIVLQDSGIAAKDARFTKLKFEYHGRYYDYEIEVNEGRTEYEYTVDAESGEILEQEWD